MNIGDDLALHEGDLIVLGRPAGTGALVNSRCFGRNDRTGDAGEVDADHIYIIPTLTKPSESFLVSSPLYSVTYRGACFKSIPVLPRSELLVFVCGKGCKGHRQRSLNFGWIRVVTILWSIIDLIKGLTSSDQHSFRPTSVGMIYFDNVTKHDKKLSSLRTCNNYVRYVSV